MSLHIRMSVGCYVLALCFGAQSANATAWQIELVDKTGAGRFSSLKVDTDGNIHVAYVADDGSSFPLKYAFRDQKLKRWFIMPVDEAVGACSLVLDSKQRPHISYVDYGAGSGAKLHYAHWDGSVWKKEKVPLNSDVIAYYSSLVLDANDNPSISFYEYRGPKETEFRIRLRNVTWNGQVWQVRTVDSQEGSGKFNAMAMDAQGKMHIAYANVSSGTEGMRYARWDGRTWQLEIIESENNEHNGYSTSIALDKDGQPHLAYSNQSTALINYASRKNGKWIIERIDRVSAVGYPDRNSIALDDRQRPYISYYDAGRGVLKLAYRQGTRWVTEEIDRNSSGFTSSTQITKDGIWISYADDAGGGLKVAHAELPESQPAGTLEPSVKSEH